ncbi:putative palmitoyl-protein thioesterase [Trypoxylus dichotomus]
MFNKFILVLFITYFYIPSTSQSNNSSTPVVIWHGLGDSCCKPNGIGMLIKEIETVIPGLYTLSIKIGSTELGDTWNSLFLHPDEQVIRACRIISLDPNLKNGFHAIGFSQGAQLLRALIQRCPGAKIKNFISLGGQHQGVYGIPMCPKWLSAVCGFLNNVVNYIVRWSWIQSLYVPFTYWHNALDETEYIKHSTFLADINNEREIYTIYTERLTNIDNFVMVKYEHDEMVIPIESSWFGFYQPGQDRKILRFNESRIYQQDRLGLRGMDLKNQLHFLSLPGGHVEYEPNWFKENIIKKFLVQTIT